MSQQRIEAFEAMVAQQPEQEMVWYGLANEYIKIARWADAEAALRRVLALKPEFTAAYQLLGTALLKQDRTAEARGVWTQGVEVAGRTGAWKARQHMESLLAGAEESATGAEFCD